MIHQTLDQGRDNRQQKPYNPWVLMSLVLFLVVFVGAGLYFSMQGVPYAFYQIPPTVAILPAIALGFALARGPFAKRLETFVGGVRDTNIILMCLIYLLAGAFSEVSRAIGSIDATINMGISLIPGSLLLPGLFLIATFMATAMGTSMGVIATVAPLAVGFAQKAGLDCAWCLGAIVSGAMFGDNLSLVSDTTIASVTTQGASLKEKFILNSWFSLPAMIVTIAVFYWISTPNHPLTVESYEWFRILPYVVILVLALMGLNVLVVLSCGIVFSGMLGLFSPAGITMVVFAQKIALGFTSMQEILVLSLFVGGLSALVNQQGGFDFFIQFINKMTKKSADNQRIGLFSIATLVSFADICAANNTIAIILSGPIAKKIAEKYRITAEKSACIIDIFSCVFQGILPYSAQILLASSFANISPIALVPKVIYCFILGIVTIIILLIKLDHKK